MKVKPFGQMCKAAAPFCLSYFFSVNYHMIGVWKRKGGKEKKLLPLC